jgi:hypothetical protein
MRKVVFALVTAAALAVLGSYVGSAQAAPSPAPKFSSAVAFDVSAPLRYMTPINRSAFDLPADDEELFDGPIADTAHTADGADPSDDCTFYFVNEYYTLAGQQSSTAGWQTRIGAFKYPSCKAGNG